ncbi:hypothetical protein FRX31_008057 [Thalictrum thalictroides]|uniref:Reverse transcriptase zinc-binding domain-containing protein n=1 Tax=Thalictrum thalictroides TaxID=46969 RepID=A0A7J6WY55_THATH|nr:hypothetical protein FRX31_008057 [Thalictrum thalictroides]
MIVWDMDLRRTMYEWEQIQFDEMVSCLGQVQLEEDANRLQWKWEKKGVFTVKTMYDQLRLRELTLEVSTSRFPCQIVWKKPLPLKIKLFFWTVILGRTQTVDNLITKGKIVFPICSMCKVSNETIPHLFLHYSKSLELWAYLIGHNSSLYANIFTADTVMEWLLAWPAGQSQPFSELLWKLLPYAIIWIIWKHRNEGIFKDKEINLRGMANEVKGVLWY